MYACFYILFFFKQKTAYEMRISYWSSNVCSSDLARSGAVWTSAFGEDSAQRHRLLGCTDLDLPADSTLRRDVDTPAQLEAAASLGLGPRTSALVSAAPSVA